MRHPGRLQTWMLLADRSENVAEQRHAREILDRKKPGAQAVVEIVGERERLGQILIEPERSGKRAPDLGNLERMRQPGADVVALMKDEDLGLVREPPECGRMDDAVAVAAEGVAHCARRFRMKPA